MIDGSFRFGVYAMLVILAGAENIGRSRTGKGSIGHDGRKDVELEQAGIFKAAGMRTSGGSDCNRRNGEGESHEGEHLISVKMQRKEEVKHKGRWWREREREQASFQFSECSQNLKKLQGRFKIVPYPPASAALSGCRPPQYYLAVCLALSSAPTARSQRSLKQKKKMEKEKRLVGRHFGPPSGSSVLFHFNRHPR